MLRWGSQGYACTDTIQYGCFYISCIVRKSVLPVAILYFYQSSVAGCWKLTIHWSWWRRVGGRPREMPASVSSSFSLFPWWLVVHPSPDQLSHWHGAACSAVINNWTPSTPQRGANSFRVPRCSTRSCSSLVGWDKLPVRWHCCLGYK